YMNKRLRNQPVHFYHLLKNKGDMNEVIENIIDKTKSRFYGAEGEQKSNGSPGDNRYMNKRLRNQPVHFYHLLKNKGDMNEVIENIIDK
ncbi:hypothetical protein CP989_25470, partial [Enterobacter hormaechei]